MKPIITLIVILYKKDSFKLNNIKTNKIAMIKNIEKCRKIEKT